jgi:hypothetical protein
VEVSELMTYAELRDQEQSPGWTVYVAELQCFLCGSLAGSVESDRKAMPLACMWHPADGGPRRLVAWRELRCQRCGGALLAESIETVTRHSLEEQPREPQRDLPRRGRPPKWLVEERLRQHEAAESRP